MRVFAPRRLAQQAWQFIGHALTGDQPNIMPIFEVMKDGSSAVRGSEQRGKGADPAGTEQGAKARVSGDRRRRAPSSRQTSS
jgi:hypothetical protein